ncbi:MAG: HK97 gp10 family phage protein [Emcibacter sp.]|nr:HK97 gp10 family phage protein [Emcibacter sp.]
MTLKLSYRMDQYDKSLVNLMEKMAGQIAENSKKRVYRNLNHKSGNSPLAESIRVEKDGDNNFRVLTDISYARYVEFGTVKFPPRPFLTPSVEEVKVTYSDLISKLNP